MRRFVRGDDRPRVSRGPHPLDGGRETRRFDGLAARLLVAALPWGLLACTAQDAVDTSVAIDDATESHGSAPQTQAIAKLAIRTLDIWGRPLSPKLATIDIAADGQWLANTEVPEVALALGRERSLNVHLSAEHFHSLELTLSFDGTARENAVSIASFDEKLGHGVLLAHEPASDGDLPTHTLFLGLRHKWFSAQARPPRPGNLVELFHSGELGWQSVHSALEVAKTNVMVSTWWWQSDFELVRDPATHASLTPEARWKNTILGVLERTPAIKRVLVGQFMSQDGLLSSMTTDAPLREHAETAGDNFEMMGMANETHGVFLWQPKAVDFTARVGAALPEASAMTFEASTPIPSNVPPREVDLTDWPIDVDINHASYHQKFLVIDDALAFVGGMNFRPVDWDTAAHDVFDFRRMNFDASEGSRIAVMNQEQLPDRGPRKDYLMRIEGPAAQDVADVFHERWQHQLDKKVDYAEGSSPFDVNRDLAEHATGLTVQITTTMPAPFDESGIAESWYNAIDNAEHYILIEDQYFRAPMLNERIKARMLEKPKLLLVVITKPINEWTDPGCAWTYLSDQLFRSMFPDRYLTLQLRSFATSVDNSILAWDETDAHFADIDIHSKLLIVDDLFLSVGSANKNNRGMIYEAEMNAVLVDAAFVRNERRATLAEILPSGATISDEPKAWFEALHQAAASNDAAYAAWDAESFDLDLDGEALPAQYLPSGLVYSLPFGQLKDCLMESVGPDVTQDPAASKP